MANLVIFGTGDIAQLARYLFTTESQREVVAFTVDREYIKAETFDGLPVVPFESVRDSYPTDSHEMFIAVSYSGMNRLRADKYDQARAWGYKLATFISPRATVYENVAIGDNCFIFEDNTLQPYARIGNDVTLWSGNHIGHHSSIGDHCFITSHVVVSGGVQIDSHCFIGVNATLRDHIHIAEACFIGPGSLMLKDTEPRQVYTSTEADLSRVPSNRLRGI